VLSPTIVAIVADHCRDSRFLLLEEALCSYLSSENSVGWPYERSNLVGLMWALGVAQQIHITSRKQWKLALLSPFAIAESAVMLSQRVAGGRMAARSSQAAARLMTRSVTAQAPASVDDAKFDDYKPTVAAFFPGQVHVLHVRCTQRQHCCGHSCLLVL
jgi:hypothetical protein